ncbi:hypothetical protein GGR58DRAFT_525537, partial [Xylaria digitata]
YHSTIVGLPPRERYLKFCLLLSALSRALYRYASRNPKRQRSRDAGRSPASASKSVTVQHIKEENPLPNSRPKASFQPAPVLPLTSEPLKTSEPSFVVPPPILAPGTSSALAPSLTKTPFGSKPTSSPSTILPPDELASTLAPSLPKPLFGSKPTSSLFAIPPSNKSSSTSIPSSPETPLAPKSTSSSFTILPPDELESTLTPSLPKTPFAPKSTSPSFTILPPDELASTLTPSLPKTPFGSKPTSSPFSIPPPNNLLSTLTPSLPKPVFGSEPASSPIFAPSLFKPPPGLKSTSPSFTSAPPSTFAPSSSNPFLKPPPTEPKPSNTRSRFTSPLAANAFRQAFPYSASRCSTPGNGLCGLHAIRESIQAQAPYLPVPSVRELLAVLDEDHEDNRRIAQYIDEARYMKGRPEKDASNNNRSWFLIDHLCAIFSLWGRGRGLEVTLGVQVANQGYHLSDNEIKGVVVWVYHNGSNHYAGLRPL